MGCGTPFRRIIRTQRIIKRAAELLDEDAEALYECSTIDGDWRDEHDAKADHDERRELATELLGIIGLASADGD